MSQQKKTEFASKNLRSIVKSLNMMKSKISDQKNVGRFVTSQLGFFPRKKMHQIAFIHVL